MNVKRYRVLAIALVVVVSVIAFAAVAQAAVRIPGEFDQSFGLKSSTHSGRNRPPIPEQIDHPAGVLAGWCE